MGKKRTKLSDQLRQAIETADKSRYVLAQETGIDQATLSRFMHGKGGLSTEGMDLLGESLGLELKLKRATRKPTKRPTQNRTARKKRK